MSASRVTPTARKRVASLAKGRPLWSRQPEEPEPAYAALESYLGEGPVRPTYTDFCAKYDIGYSSLTKWAHQWRWKERTAAYDRRVVEDVRAEIVEVYAADAPAVTKRQTLISEKLHALVNSELDKLLARSQSSDEGVITPKTLLAIVQMALIMDRTLCPDGSDPTAANERPIDLGRLSTADLGELRRLAAKTQDHD